MSINNLNLARPRVRSRKGMTLIEMLMVIAIIAVLAGLLIPVIGAVRRRGQVTTTVLEIQNLKNAIEQYKQKFGDYPPDGSNSVVLERHIRIAFPRIHSDDIDWLRTSLGIQLYNNGNVIPKNTSLDPAEALVFFLGGFSEDPRYPFSATGGPANLNRNPGLFDFDPNRFSDDDNDGFAVYHPRGSDVPFVYFDSRTYMPRKIYGYVAATHYPLAGSISANSYAANGVARPYRSDQLRQATPDDGYLFQWVNKNTFQLIAAGVTNDYGDDRPPVPLNNIPTRQTPYKHYPSGQSPNNVPYSDGDKSNITSFSRGALEDDIP